MCHAGVIGYCGNTIEYDLWGSDVQIAAALMTTSDPNRVHVSDSTLSLLENDFDYVQNNSFFGRKTNTYFLTKERSVGKTYFTASHDYMNTNALAVALDAARTDPLWSMNTLNSQIEHWVKTIEKKERSRYVDGEYESEETGGDGTSHSGGSGTSRSDFENEKYCGDLDKAEGEEIEFQNETLGGTLEDSGFWRDIAEDMGEVELAEIVGGGGTGSKHALDSSLVHLDHNGKLEVPVRQMLFHFFDYF